MKFDIRIVGRFLYFFCMYCVMLRSLFLYMRIFLLICIIVIVSMLRCYMSVWFCGK